MQAHVETRATCWCLHYIERCVRAMLKYVKNKARLTGQTVPPGGDFPGPLADPLTRKRWPWPRPDPGATKISFQNTILYK